MTKSFGGLAMRLIDAESTKKLAQEHLIDPYHIVSACDVIDKAETVDAVPVVRCRECVHYTDWGACGNPDNGWDAPPMGPEDFCSRGERKTDGN